MKWIAHRGNIFGNNAELENSPSYIQAALDAGFHVFVDAWFKDDEWWTGYDFPQYKTTKQFLSDERLLVNVRNQSEHPFQCDTRKVCLYPNSFEDLNNFEGVCSDYIGWFRQRQEATKRIAMYISGRLNCHKECLLPQLRRYLYENKNTWIDVFLSLNDSPCNLEKYMESLDPPFIALLECENYITPQHFMNYPIKRIETNIQTAVSQVYNNWKAMHMIQKYVCKKNIHYDLIVKYRPDIVAPRLPDFCMPLPDEPIVFIPLGSDHSGINDQIAYGNMKGMIIYSDIYPQLGRNIQTNTYLLHPETMLYCQLIEKVILYRFDYEYTLDPRRHH